jgi:hypothetical protein
MNFEKHFPKTIYEGEIEISEGLEETWGRRENLLRVGCGDMDTRGFSKFIGYSTYVICSRVWRMLEELRLD